METNTYLAKMNFIQNSLFDFLDNEESNEDHFQNLIKILNEQKINENKNIRKSTLHLISNIANNHHRSSLIFPKIEQIIKNYKEIIISTLSNREIFDICRSTTNLFLLMKEWLN